MLVKKSIGFLGTISFVLLAAATASKATSLNMTLLSQNHDYADAFYSDIWGFTSPAGVEYAIIGQLNGTIFYNLADPSNPVEVGYITGPTSGTRDIKTYGSYVYISTEGGGGLQIVDMIDPDNPNLVNTWDEKFGSAHNLFIDIDRGIGYACGTLEGMHLFDLFTDPVHPTQTKLWRSMFKYYVHDLHVDDDTLWAMAINQGRMHVLANPDASTLMEVVDWGYPNSATHSGWWHTDHRYFLTTDETNNGRLRIWDVSDKTNISQVGAYQAGTNTSIHNAYVRGDYAFLSYYTEGVRVVDVSDPTTPIEVAYYDTYAGTGLNDGNWGVYPFFESGILIASDIEGGLFVFSLDIPTDVPLELVPRKSATLLPNAPNPFNPETTISISIAQEGEYRLTIHDLTGRMVRALFHQQEESGMKRVVWNGTNSSGKPVASGSYFSRLTGPDLSETRKMILIR